jgi:uncharacterized membrane protein
MEQAAYPVNSGTNPQSTTYRITSIDLLRGLVMIIMALDHARDYFHGDAMLHDPLNLQTTTPVLFFTRWITHYCAPVFVFLSGISAYISGQRKNKNELGNFLMRRGLWLIFIEITVVTFGWTFNPFFSAMVLQVIWAIGISMIALGLFCRLPYQWIAVIALLIVCGHNLLDIPEATHSGKFNPLWTALHIGGFQSYALTEGHRFFIAYPVLPWIGIMMLGFVFGKLFTRETDPRQRKKHLLQAGTVMILLFVILRLINAYGDPTPWRMQTEPLYTFLSFLDVSKYPPSLMYTCMTIGPALIFLALTEHIKNRLSGIISVFGKVPFFYYILHIYLIHLLTIILFFATGYDVSDIVPPNGAFKFWFRPDNFGFSLGTTYLLWMVVVVILYFPCRWFSQYKATHKTWWLHYI